MPLAKRVCEQCAHARTHAHTHTHNNEHLRSRRSLLAASPSSIASALGAGQAAAYLQA